MSTILILSENRQFCKSACRFLKSHDELSEPHIRSFCLSCLDSSISQDNITSLFGRLYSIIDNLDSKDSSPLDRLVITNFHDEELDSLGSMDPLSRSHGWSTLVSMLILAFPEVHWVLSASHSFSDGLVSKQPHIFNSCKSLEKVLSFHHSGYNGLFDPTMLRSTIVRNVNSPPESSGRSPIPVPPRFGIAASIDEESSYSYFNAYSAYRFGYVSWNVNSWSYMRQILGPNSLRKSINISPPDLLLEDLYLKFPDRPPSESISELSTRDESFPVLKKAFKRFIITVGHQKNSSGKNIHRQNRSYLRQWLAEKRSADISPRADIIRKPLGGIFDLWKSIGEWSWSLWDSSGQPNVEEAFDWPPDPTRDIEQGHSAPGRLLLIADKLTQRSRAVLEQAKSPSDAFLAATLALNAKELLANRTPTTALKALTLQHRAEVMAESLFHGIEFNLDVESRFADIKREVKAISRWFSGRRRRRVALNARLAIVEELAREFSELDQFEEERKCRAEARRLYFDFWAYQSSWRLFLLPLLRYLSFSLRSLPVFLGLVTFWIILFGVGWDLLEPTVHGVNDQSFWNAFTSSVVFFFTLTPPGTYWGGAERQVLWNSVITFQSVVSLSHLGLLVSHIYLIVSRR